jgi:hypothetical protein
MSFFKKKILIITDGISVGNSVGKSVGNKKLLLPRDIPTK